MSVPQIVSIKFGNVCVKKNDILGNFKDVIIEPNGFYEWNFREGFNPEFDEKPTSHQYKKDPSKGIQPHSIRNLLNKGDIFILTSGFYDDLGINKNTIKFLENNGKKVVIVNSKDIVNTYNNLVGGGKNIVALVHSTC